jgi:hypothetical protein
MFLVKDERLQLKSEVEMSFKFQVPYSNYGSPRFSNRWGKPPHLEHLSPLWVPGNVHVQAKGFRTGRR